MNLSVIPGRKLRELFKDNTEILRLFKAHRISDIRDPQPGIAEKLHSLLYPHFIQDIREALPCFTGDHGTQIRGGEIYGPGDIIQRNIGPVILLDITDDFIDHSLLRAGF